MVRKWSIEDFRHMSVDERIKLIEDLWASIAPEDLPPLTQAQEMELERRLADYRENPSSSIPWEAVKSEMLKRHSS